MMHSEDDIMNFKPKEIFVGSSHTTELCYFAKKKKVFLKYPEGPHT